MTGVKLLGPMGLLAELELRAGLGCEQKDVAADRLLAYCTAMGEYRDSCRDGELPFYARSFDVDMIGVAQRVLQWRDALVYAGLGKLEALPDGLHIGAGRIVSDILGVERFWSSESSVADRWMRLLEAGTYLDEGWEIEVRMREKLVEPTIRECLDRCGANVTYLTEVPKPGHKLRMLRFQSLTDGYQWALTREGMEKAVYVNSDNVTFNAVLESLGKELVDAASDGAFTQVSQLFGAGLRLFAPNPEYSDLVAYLSVPYHPLNDYVTEDGVSLKRKLLGHITANGGWGKDDRSQKSWDDLLGEARQRDCREYAMPLNLCIGQWKSGCSLEAIRAYCDALGVWIEKKTPKVPDACVREQLSCVGESFRLLPGILRLTGKISFKYDELMMLVRSVSACCSYRTASAQQGSVEVVPDIRAIASDCDRVVWTDCVDRGMGAYAYSFLPEDDISKLNDAGMKIPMHGSVLKAEALAAELAFAHIRKELVVLVPGRMEGRSQYPVHIGHWDGKVEDMCQWVPDGRMVDVRDANTQQMEHKVDSAIFKGLEEPKEGGVAKRDKESFSSLKMLVQHPFDYVMEYLMGCKTAEEDKIALVKGNVVHTLLNNVMVDSEYDWDEAKSMLTDGFEYCFNRAVSEVGLMLLGASNSMVLTQFKAILKQKAIPSFIKIIDANSLKIVGSEVCLAAKLEEIGDVEAKIDLLLEDRDRNYVVFDFKWTDGKDSKRLKEIEENREMQLALYSAVVEKSKGRPVVASGYFMPRQGKLITSYKGFAEMDEVEVVEKNSNDSILQMVRNSYIFRMQQLIGADGESVIEEGEMMELGDNQPAYDAVEGLFPLEKSSKKKASSYGKNVILKGMLK